MEVRKTSRREPIVKEAPADLAGAPAQTRVTMKITDIRCYVLEAQNISHLFRWRAGLLLVVVKLTCNYYQGAEYDDLLHLKTTVTKARGVRITLFWLKAV